MASERLIGKRRDDGSLQELSEHTRYCLAVLEELLKSRSFRSFCGRWELEPEEAKNNLRLATILHDIGKGTVDFQRAIRENRQSAVSHRLSALPIADEILGQIAPKDILGNDKPLLILSLILAHHSCLHSDIFSSQSPRDIPIHHSLSDFIREFPEFTNASLASSKVPLDKAQRMVRGIETLLSDKIAQPADAARVKSIFAYFLSLLKLSDWIASRAFGEDKAPEVPLFSPPKREDILKGKIPYNFQRRLADAETPFLVLRAPCGRGKTEGAILWFLNLWEKGLAERLVFAMPTQVTSNAMRERLANLFGKENVALYHGRSFLEQAEIKQLEGKYKEMGEEEILPLLKEENLWGEVMGKPVVITTVDHILYSFIHGFPQADFAFGNLQTSAIVFDEVHSYDYLMLSHLRSAFRLLREMKIPHLLMSATLPQFLFQELRLSDYQFIEDEEGNKIKRFSLRKKEDPLVDEGGNLNDAVLREIEKRNEKGEKQFIILNTVRRAQRVYLQLKERGLPALLLHSRFAYAHRRKKEKLAIERLEKEEPFILVATQVIEVSLDISSQTLYTELAPLDAVVQRAGRLNRRAMRGDYKLFLYRPIDYNPYREKREIMDRSWELLEEKSFSQGDLVERTSAAYAGVELRKTSSLPRLFEETVVFGHSPREIRFSEEEGRVFQTRDIECPSEDVIPWDIFLGLEKEDIGILLRYLTPVPRWWIAYSLKEGRDLFIVHEVKGKRFLICKVPYDEELGFDEGKLGEIMPSSGGVFID